MSTQIIGRACWLVVLAASAAAAQASPGPKTVTLLPTYVPDSHLNYSVVIHSSIGTRATLDTTAAVDMHVLSGATPGNFDAELKFTKYATTVKADLPADQTNLEQQSSAIDHAALTMTPAHFRVSPGKVEVIARPNGADFDQPVEMLEELVRTDGLPNGPVAVGNHWTFTRSRDIPTMNFSVALAMDCSLTAFGEQNGQPTATIVIHSHGSTPLPPGSLPGSQEMASQGLVPEASVAFDTDATSVYRAKDAVLESTTSETNNQMHIKFIGPSPNAQTMDTTIHSTSTVRLESHGNE
ncbi:MAG TPA: hypothetical protein VN709_07475 [Terriglobales bacterium]|nr:hypothetical protein [Terriglobales bacterium]